MATKIFMSLFIIIVLLPTATSIKSCPTSRCSEIGTGPLIRFPFRLTTTPPNRCSYPEFDLSCSLNNETILTIPFSGQFTVKIIDYVSQTLWINDPNNCLPKRFLNFTTSMASPFLFHYGMNLTFLNCSSNVSSVNRHVRPIFCLSGENFTVTAIPTGFSGDWKVWPCREIRTVLVPVSEPVWGGIYDDVGLRWSEPDCGACEAAFGDCGFRSDSGLEISCSIPAAGNGKEVKYNGIKLSRTTKYAIILGAGVPCLLCVIGLACFVCCKVKANHHHRHTTELSTSLAPRATVITMGLDRPTIESYPKTIVGQNRQLPRPNDNTCSICLSEYQPEEVLRTIPECNHYFHLHCIDEWLWVNATCPICRKPPSSSSASSL